jgi:ribosomal protein S18 acetylase RimI-like enzyme
MRRVGLEPTSPKAAGFEPAAYANSATAARGRSLGPSRTVPAVARELRIRPATLEDDEALRGLDLRTWSPKVSPSDRPPAHRAFFRDDTVPADVLVAESVAEVVGYVHLGRATPLASNRHVAHIRGLAVHPAHRRRGIARALIEAGARAAAERGDRRLTLRVFATNPDAQALYASCGFVVEGILREEFRIQGRYVDDVLMALDLTSGDR